MHADDSGTMHADGSGAPSGQSMTIMTRVPGQMTRFTNETVACGRCTEHACPGRRRGLGGVVRFSWGVGQAGMLHTQDVAKVDVEETAVGCQHEVVKMAISHSQDVGHHTIASTALEISLVDLRLDAEWCCRVT